jgi:hypothetical protein
MSGFLLIRTVAHCFRTTFSVVADLVRLAFLAAHSRRALAAENLFLRKQLALFQERKVKPRRANDSTRWMMATLSRMFAWRGALVNVKADTLILCSAEIPSEPKPQCRNVLQRVILSVHVRLSADPNRCTLLPNDLFGRG